MVLLKGWKFTAFVGTIIGAIGLAIYPIIVSPMVNPAPYSKPTFFSNYLSTLNLKFQNLLNFTEKQQAVNRSGIKQEEVQPGSKKTLMSLVMSRTIVKNVFIADMKVWTDPFGRPKEKETTEK